MKLNLIYRNSISAAQKKVADPIEPTAELFPSYGEAFDTDLRRVRLIRATGPDTTRECSAKIAEKVLLRHSS